MVNYNPLLLIDFYKSTHAEQYPKSLTKMVSYYTPRMSRLEDVDRVTMFGLQGFIKEYLIDGFNNNFFQRPKREVINEYRRVLNATLGEGAYSIEKIEKLHDLGYLPLEIKAVPEGMRTAIGVPQIEISNTHPDFVWLVNTIETMLSCYMWHIQVSAEVGNRYWNIVNKYWNLTCDETVDPHRLLGDFSMRGQQSVESATKSSAAWCLNFYNTATVPAILWLEDNYNCDCAKDTVAYGAISTEHSVMCSNYAVDGDEVTHIKRLLTDIYPNHNFSMVSDSYDYENLVTNLLPQCRTEIETHNGTISIRGDSGDPIEVIAGKDIRLIPDSDWEKFNENREEYLEDDFWDEEEDGEFYYYCKDHYFKVVLNLDWGTERGSYTDSKYYIIYKRNITVEEITPTIKEMGTVWALWQEFGGTINSKGYKVLNTKVKAIYGDSITPDRCKEIYRRLQQKGFAINNVSLGVGSFSMMCLETIDSEDIPHYSPYTRDTFGIAVKATYAEDTVHNPIMIYKQPKECSWKKSQKGCCIVARDGMSYTDGHTFFEADSSPKNLLDSVFYDGNFVKIFTLDEVRKNLEESR